ncbi:hypothetical protein JB92DRAFT_3110835 [Gautieria morchelliformis]|nr:hypothetical protein JB92DRAFT_3110835 [Gautieria morchelliformis]
MPSQPSEYGGLADAIPDTRFPLPRDGNRDEMLALSMLDTLSARFHETTVVFSEIGMGCS